MSFCDYLMPVQDLYYGFFPDAPNPLYYKWNYQSDFVVERKNLSCYECKLEQAMGCPSRCPPQIGEYHADGRFYSGQMLKLHKPQACSKALSEQIEQLDHERHLDKYGLHWQVPWRCCNTQYSYMETVPCLSINELNPTLASAWTTDKVNSSLLITQKGPIRFSRGLMTPMGRLLET